MEQGFVIEVGCSHGGNNTDNGSSTLTVSKLMDALDYVENAINLSNVTIKLYNYREVLERGFVFKGIENISLKSLCGGYSYINCQPHGGGLYFANGSSITIHKVVFAHCGYNFTNYYQPSLSWPAIFVFEFIKDITFENVMFSQSIGTAIKLLNCHGNIVVSQVLFSEGQVPIENEQENLIGGGSIYILQDSTNSSTNITNSLFTSNRVTGGGYTRGGAIAVIYHTAYNTLTLTNIYFNGNNAMLGSCMYMAFVGTANHNEVSIQHGQIYGHKCYNSNEGSTVKYKCVGTLNVQYLLDPFSAIAGYNSFTICHTEVSKNVAYAGGAISVSAVRQSTQIAYTNSFNMSEIKMQFNRAQVGSTLHLSDLPTTLLHSAGYLLMPVLQGYISNSFVTNKSNVTIGQATIYSNKMSIRVSPPSLTIEQCIGTAVVMSNAELRILSNTTVKFDHNTGKLGGAIALINQATLKVDNGSSLLFIANKANDKGGALYISNYYDNYAIPLCGVQCAVRFDENTSFYFNENVADNKPNSIFATSVLSCSPNHIITMLPLERRPFCWSNWYYMPNSSCQEQVFTSPATIQLTESSSAVEIFPGFPFPLPIRLVDDYGKVITSKFVVTAFVVKGEATVDSSSQYIAGGNVTVYAHPNTSITLAIETSEPRVVYTELAIKIQQCPPGYYNVSFFPSSNDKQKGMDCTCGKGYQRSNVVLCDKSTATARITNGWCMTYDKDLGMAIIGSWQFYSLIQHQLHDGYYTLPSRMDQLDEFFCGPLKRTGRLCGQCQEGYGVPIYSYDSQCVPCDEKDWPKNMMLYLLAELVPLTVFFIIVIIFNISITSGSAKAFVFFSQMATIPTVIYTLQEQINMFVSNNWSQSVILSVFVLPYSIWNLDFLRTILPPFCLAPSISMIHVMTLNYISAVYSLLLIIVVYAVIELHASNCRPVTYVCMPLCRCLSRLRRNWKIRTSFIDAFATFLVLSYTKLCAVSFLLLVPNIVYSATGEVKGLSLLWMDASVEYGSPKHIWLMVIAICVLCFIVIPLPLILLLYPLKTVQRCLHKTHLNSRVLRAFMDSFQGCYKIGTEGSRDMRCFSSLYFFLRSAMLAVMMSASDQDVDNVLHVLQFIIIIVLLAAFRPYKNQWNNVLDIFIFSVMTLIGALTIMESPHHQLSIGMLVCGYILIFLPLLYMSVYVCRGILKDCKWKKKRLAVSIVKESSLSEFDFPDRVLNPLEYAALLSP